MKSDSRVGVILLVEDTTSWAKAFSEILKLVNEHREVRTVDREGFFASFKSSSDFDQVDLCFIDLELGGGNSPQCNDLDGLKKVLPRIRELAPWLPTGCISRYISMETPSVIADLSVSEFDFFAPKRLFGESGDFTRLHPEFNVAKWQGILSNIQIKRAASISGQSIIDLQSNLANPGKIEFDDITLAQMESQHLDKTTFHQAITLLGILGTRIHVESLQSGFSGQYVSKISVHGSMCEEPVDTYWMVKWGNPIRKLDREARVHREFFQRGIDRSLQIPQMNPGAIMWGGVGFLCYAFEKNAVTALNSILASGLNAFCKNLDILVNGMYLNKRKQHINAINEVTKWTALSKEEASFAAGESIKTSLEVTWALIHGDLHLQNIFVNNETPTLIDFGRSGFGPVAIDAAKMIVDSLFFAISNVDNLPRTLDFDSIIGTELRTIVEAFEKQFISPDDRKMFEYAIRAYSLKYLTYEDVQDHKKDYFRKILNIG